MKGYSLIGVTAIFLLPDTSEGCKADMREGLLLTTGEANIVYA